MREINIFTLSILIICSPLCAQKHDANWPFGFQEYSGNNAYGNAVIRFSSDTVEVNPVAWQTGFENAAAAISDPGGNLLFTTNGCTIYTASGDTMAAFPFNNPVLLNLGAVHELVCGAYGYPAPQSLLILPQPGSKNRYYLFHLSTQYHPETKWEYFPFYYTVIDMDAASGEGQVLGKPNPLLGNEPAEPFTAVRHGNGRDWWILVAGRNTNYYIRFLFTPEGITTSYFQAIGPVIACPRIGSSVFSPDGRKYARTQNCQTIVFDFDRCTGLLSNPIVFERPSYVFGGGGVAFSPNGNRLFVSEQLAILSADLTDSNPVLDTLVPSTKMIGTSLGLFQAAPNGRIYSNSTHRSRYMASFKQTDGSDVDFQAKSLDLGKYSARTLPHFPNYRLYDLPDSPCDTLGIDGPVSATTSPQQKARARVFPNPFMESLNVELPLGVNSATFALYDQLGRLTLSQTLGPGTHTVNTPLLPTGFYFWKLSEPSGARQMGKLLKTAF